MKVIAIQEPLATTLRTITTNTLLCDANGRALGVISPLEPGLHVTDLQLEPPSSIAETEELRKIRTGKPLDEILHRLGLPSDLE